MMWLYSLRCALSIALLFRAIGARIAYKLSHQTHTPSNSGRRKYITGTMTTLQRKVQRGCGASLVQIASALVSQYAHLYMQYA
eukprot:4427-Heterococcus_DN1.PRE.6